jgi:hypothetical protein
MNKLQVYLKEAQLEHKLVREKTVALPHPSPPEKMSKTREQLLQTHLEQLKDIIAAVIFDIYGTSVDRDFIDKQILPRVLKAISRWTGIYITEKVPKTAG